VIAELGGTIDLDAAGTYAQNGGSTLAVTIDAVHTTFSGITGGYTNLDGTLRVTTLGTPAGGSHWPIISGVGRSGAFSAYDFGGVDYGVEYPSTGVTLVAPAVVHHPTSTGVSCSPTTVVAGSPTTCTATVTDTAATGETSPTGTVSFTTSGAGTFSSSSCNVAGSGSSASCSVTYTPSASPSNPVRSDTITAGYGGDTTHASSSGQTTVAVLSISLLARGSFVIGDTTPTSSTVTFWGAQWSTLNSLSAGSAPAAFKGFAGNTPSKPPQCGDHWSTDAGASSASPDTVPLYMAVIVASQVTKSGSTISGDTRHVVVVKTDPGYGPNPGHPGTGSVVAQIC
jgi:hypothetical protein